MFLGALAALGVAGSHSQAAWAQSGGAPQAMSRRPPAKPTRTVLAPGEDGTHLQLKLAEDTSARRRNGRFVSSSGAALSSLEDVLREAGIGPSRIHRLFARTESDLDAEKRIAESRSGRKLADLNLYYDIAVPAGVSIEALCDALNALPAVELAAPAPLPEMAPADMAPTTPDYQGEQGYRQSAPYGIGASDVTAVAGAGGAGVAIVDIEYNWVLDHEDLELGDAANIDSAALYDPYPQDEGNHGTAALEILGGRRNAYGLTGLVFDATVLVAPAMTVSDGYNVARAVNLAAQALEPGDVILIEQQNTVCGGGDLGPVEWYSPIFDAIATTTALGIAVVEAAGNGAVNLDDPACAGRFDRSVHDSGAIIVGAGDPGSRARLSFSTYGSRVDLQGWGKSVATAGYGALFDPGDARQRYTASFSGTSSASPIVAGAVVAVQGALLAQGRNPLAPDQIRELLVSTGTVQPAPDAQTPIGPLPDVPAALAALPEPQDLAGLASGSALIAGLTRRHAQRRHRRQESGAPGGIRSYGQLAAMCFRALTSRCSCFPSFFSLFSAAFWPVISTLCPRWAFRSTPLPPTSSYCSAPPPLA
jgi:subtilisin family serine protease